MLRLPLLLLGFSCFGVALGSTGSSSSKCSAAMDEICPTWKVNGRDCKRCTRTLKEQLGKLGCSSMKLIKCENRPKVTFTPDKPAAPVFRVSPAKGAPQPHIVVVVGDDQGWANVGYHNEGNVYTPNMDSLAADGIELDRYYAAWFCGPSRSSFMTGRTPNHAFMDADHLYRGFTTLASKLQSVGYSTHLVGKWGIGVQCDWMTPAQRGFNTSLGYLAAWTDHYSFNQPQAFGCPGKDLYDTDGPAYGRDGKFGEYIWRDEVERILKEYEAKESTHPLFLYVAMEVMHSPQQVPDKYKTWYRERNLPKGHMANNAMMSAGDDLLGNVTNMLKQKGLWDNTLLLYASDNGGSVQGNNYPLRGAKMSHLEGGVRVIGFLNGGFLPSDMRKKRLDGYVHVSDWYTTFGHLAGYDPTDDHAGDAPGVDGINVWPYLAGKMDSSPRKEILLGCHDNGRAHGGAFVKGPWKLHVGYEYIHGWFTPTAYVDNKTTLDCTQGCLYNIREDPSERHDYATEKPDVFSQMMTEYTQHCQNTFEAESYGSDAAACQKYKQAHKGFVGPFMSEDAC